MMWLAILGIVGLLLWAALQPSELKEATQAERERANRIVMEDVTIQVFDSRMHVSAVVRGREAITFKNNQDFIVEPVRSILHRTTGKHVRINADRLWKRISRHDERMEFSGDVQVIAPEQKLLSQALTYHPNTHYLESEAPIQMITTGTIITSEKLKSNIDIQTGSLEGDVKIVSLGNPENEFERPLNLDGQTAKFDLVRGVYRVTGEASVDHVDMHVDADYIAYMRDQGTVHCKGNVVAKHLDLTLKCQNLVYQVNRRLGKASGDPQAVQIVKPKNPNESDVRNTIEGEPLELDMENKILKGDHKVVVKREVVFEDEWDPDLRIDAKSLRHHYELGRTNFTENVHIHMSSLGANGDRAIFYQQAGRLYIIGKAHAWDLDISGNAYNHIYGEKIIHYLKTGKSMVLQGGVRTREEGGR